MKKIILILFLTVSMAAACGAYAEMSDPDIEGRIANIDYVKHEIVVSNVLADNHKHPGDVRVRVKEGMISNFKLRDYVKVKFRPEGFDRKETAMIELMKR